MEKNRAVSLLLRTLLCVFYVTTCVADLRQKRMAESPRYPIILTPLAHTEVACLVVDAILCKRYQGACHF